MVWTGIVGRECEGLKMVRVREDLEVVVKAVRDEKMLKKQTKMMKMMMKKQKDGRVMKKRPLTIQNEGKVLAQYSRLLGRADCCDEAEG